MPIFFFVGGFSNLVAYDVVPARGESDGSVHPQPAERLLRPSLVFLAVWVVVQVVLHLADVGAPPDRRSGARPACCAAMLPPGPTMPFGPLWFLGVYLVVVVHLAVDDRAAPAVRLVGAGRRWCRRGRRRRHRVRRRPPASCAGPTSRSCCCSRTSSATSTATAACCAGRGRRSGRWSLVGLAGLVLLTNPPICSSCSATYASTGSRGSGTTRKSLLGTDVEAVSNAYPPTVCFLLGGDLVDRRGDAAAAGAEPLAPATARRGRRRSRSTA